MKYGAVAVHNYHGGREVEQTGGQHQNPCKQNIDIYILGASKVTANPYYNWVNLYWEGCVMVVYIWVIYETLSR